MSAIPGDLCCSFMLESLYYIQVQLLSCYIVIEGREKKKKEVRR